MHTWSGLVASTAAHDAEVFLCFWHLEMSLSCISTALRFTLTKKKKQRSSSSIVVRSQCVCARAGVEVLSHISSGHPLDLGSLVLLCIRNRPPKSERTLTPRQGLLPTVHTQKEGERKSENNSDDRGHRRGRCSLQTTDAPSEMLHVLSGPSGRLTNRSSVSPQTPRVLMEQGVK